MYCVYCIDNNFGMTHAHSIQIYYLIINKYGSDIATLGCNNLNLKTKIKLLTVCLCIINDTAIHMC